MKILEEEKKSMRIGFESNLYICEILNSLYENRRFVFEKQKNKPKKCLREKELKNDFSLN